MILPNGDYSLKPKLTKRLSPEYDEYVDESNVVAL